VFLPAIPKAKIKILGTVIFFHYLYGSETSSLTLRDGYQLRKFEYRVLRCFVPIKPSTTDLATHGAGK